MKTVISAFALLLCSSVLPAYSAAPPTLTPPTAENVAAGMATLVLQSSESGSGYITLLPGSGVACGTGTQVKAGQNSAGSPVGYRGSLTLSANVPARYTVRNLLQSTAYTVCFSADSPTGQNLQEIPATIDVSTSMAVSLANKDWGAIGGTGFSTSQAFSVSIVFAPDGTPYTLYGGNGSKATVMKYLSGAWIPVGNPGFSANDIQTPSLAFALDGTPYVAYQDMGANNNNKAAVMRFDGTNWVAAGNSGFTSGNALYTSLAFAPDGTPFLAYMDYAASYKATVMKFNDNAWSLVGNAGFSAGQASFNSLAFASDGTPFVAYQDGGNGNKITVQKFDGNSWIPVGSAAFSAGTASYTKLAFSPDNVAYVAFQDGGNSNKATVMKFNGSGWVPVGSPGVTTGTAGSVSLAFSPDGTPSVSFQDGSKEFKATVMKFDGSNWFVVGSSGFSKGSAHSDSLSFAPDGTPHVAYVDYGNAGKVTVMRLGIGDTTTMLSTDKSFASSGESVLFTATISYSAATGTVSFMDGTALLGTSPLANGIATYSTSALPVGIHAITAVYAGESGFNGSSSTSLRVEIFPAGVLVTSAISSPVSGYVTNTTSLNVAGTAAGVTGNPVTQVEVSVDGGTTWLTATGTSAWNRSLSFPIEGVFLIKSRAKTGTGVVETPKTGISVTIDRSPPTGVILGAVQNDAASLTVTLYTQANTPGWGCLDIIPRVCGYQDISISYDGITWTPWVQAEAIKRYSIAMVGRQTAVYAKLRDAAGNISVVLSAPVKINGVCGSANDGNYTAIPTTGLCTLGTSSAVSGSGPWNWFCSDAFGGATASCSAKQAGGIVYRSTDSGVTWTAGKSGSGFNSGADTLLVSPTYASDHTLFLGADGIYKSVDSGDNWKKVLSGYKLKAFAASPSYATDHTIFAASYLNGIFKSSDGGDTWTSNVRLSPSTLFSLAISPGFSSDHTIFAGISGEGVFKSSDGGANWSAANTGISTLTALSLAISPAYGSDHTIFAAVTDGIWGNDGPHYNIYKSIDSGATWNQADTGISGSISALSISPGYSSDQTLFAVSSTGIYKSIDSGVTWTAVNSAASGNSILLSPIYASDQNLFAGIFGVNVFNSSNGGNTWNPSNSSFGDGNKLTGLSISPSFGSDHTVFAVTSLVGPSLNVYPSSLTFGNVLTNSPSQSMQIILKNDFMGDANLTITSIILGGASASQFGIAPGNCGSLTPTIPVGGQCSISVTFSPTSSGGKNATLQINSNATGSSSASFSLSGNGIVSGVCGIDNGFTLAAATPTRLCGTGTPSVISGDGHPWLWTCQGDTGTDPVPCNASIQTYTLTVNVSTGTGSGDVTADIFSNDTAPVSIFCPTSFCSGFFDFGKTVKLTALPDPVSLFTSWQGDCTSDPCDILMTAPRSVTASFFHPQGFNNVTKGVFDNSLDTSMLAAAAGDEIRMLATEFSINTFTLNKAVTLAGGWKANYLARAAEQTVFNGELIVQSEQSKITGTTVRGSLTIKSGGLRVDGVTILPPQ